MARNHKWIYLGITETGIYKIGYTERTCWARCKTSDYIIFSAMESDQWTLEDLILIEGYVRKAFAEIGERYKTDYFFIDKKRAEVEDYFRYKVAEIIKFISATSGVVIMSGETCPNYY